jgi:hypothetical protein
VHMGRCDLSVLIAWLHKHFSQMIFPTVWYDKLKGHQMGSVLISLFGARFAFSSILRLYCHVAVQIRDCFVSTLE